MRVILVWEEIPEQTTVFVFENLPTDMVEIFKKAHGFYVNTIIKDPEIEKAVMAVNDFLDGLKDRNSYKVDEPVQSDCESLVVICGFIC